LAYGTLCSLIEQFAAGDGFTNLRRLFASVDELSLLHMM